MCVLIIFETKKQLIKSREKQKFYNHRDYNTLSQQLKRQQNNIQLKGHKNISKNKHDMENS